MRTGGASGPFKRVDDLDAMRRSGQFQVVTPEECIENVRRTGTLMIAPLISGFAPKLAWEGLELFERQVLPALFGVGTTHRLREAGAGDVDGRDRHRASIDSTASQALPNVVAVSM